MAIDNATGVANTACPSICSRQFSKAEERLTRYLQGVPDADEQHPIGVRDIQYHTGRLPNGPTGGHNPRLLLMGQRR